MILIDMDMPTSCEECPLGSKGNIAVGCKLSEYAWAYSWGKGKLPYCPLHEITESDTISRPQWIPCSERLPEDGERVLATHLGGLNPDRQVIEHIYKNGEFTLGWDMDMNMDSPTFGQRYVGKVVAWMPLPEPYLKGDTI